MPNFKLMVFALASCCVLGGALHPGGYAAETMAWKAGPSTREVENGAVLEDDLIFAKGNGQGGPQYYPQAAVVQWAPIPAEQPGRYRVALRARTEKFGPNHLVLQAWVRQEDGGTFTPTGYGPVPIPIASFPMSGYAFDAPGQWKDFALEFEVEPGGKPVTAGLMYLGDTACASGKLQVEKASLRLEKMDRPVFISWARPVKLRYHHAEAGALEFRLANVTAQPQEVEVRPVIVSDADERAPGPAARFTVPPMTALDGTAPFVVPATDGGYEAMGELRLGGKTIDQRGDVFAVSDSPFRCLIDGNLSGISILAAAYTLGLKGFKEEILGKWEQYVGQCRASAENLRREYATGFEYFAWAREDATEMTEDSDEPYLTGQTSYPVSRKQILMLNEQLKRHGIAPVAYVNACPFGWDGFKLLRRHPEWFAYDRITGQPLAMFNTESIEKYTRGEQVNPGYPAIETRFDNAPPVDGKLYLGYHRDYLEHHMSQMAASAKRYGWEAFRYDAAPLSTNAFPTVKQRLATLNPPVGIGNNLGICALGVEPSASWKIYCQDESLMMEEDIRHAFQAATDPHRRWTDWIDYLRRGSHLTRSNGGHYCFINYGSNFYATALGYAVGAHPYSGFQKSPFGDYERFMIRYGSYFWDLRTQMLPEAEKAVRVTSARPLWWKTLVSQRAMEKGHRQVIVPLFNPPAEEEVVGTTIAGPADGAKVAFTPSANEIVTAWLLAPEPVAQRRPLEPKRLPGGGVEVTVPRFWAWSNVVFDCHRK